MQRTKWTVDTVNYQAQAPAYRAVLNGGRYILLPPAEGYGHQWRIYHARNDAETFGLVGVASALATAKRKAKTHAVSSSL